MRQVVAVVALLAFVVAVYSQENCKGTPNLNPIITSPAALVGKTANGLLYQFDGPVDPPLKVLHVYGTPYEMGFAHGTLLRKEIARIVPDVFAYMEAQIDQYLQFLPEWLRKLIEEIGVTAALEATIWMTELYTPQHFKDEMRGIADAVPEITYSQIYEIMMIPELIQAACSIYGSWGPAIANSTGSTLFQVRALDWTTNGPFQKYPVVIVYHPESGHGHPFSIVTWAGFIGAITGYSSAPVGVCEKVWLSYNGTYSRIGAPWHFVLRDILQFDKDTPSAISRIRKADRTCSIWVGLGHVEPNNKKNIEFNIVQYSYQQVNVFDWDNSPEYPGHPKLPGVQYVDKHVQPSRNPCLGSLLQRYYGNITAEVSIKDITSVFQTGDMHIAIYDFARQYMYVSNAGVYDPTTKKADPAYDRTFVRLPMAELFAVSRP